MRPDIANDAATACAARLPPSALTGRTTAHVMPCATGGVLHPAACAALERMAAAARADGIQLAAVSGFRSFEQQLAIWNGKFRGERPLLSREGEALDALAMDEPARIEAILAWSALPGASRHHWGTDCDVIDRAALPDGARPRLVPVEYAAGGWFAPLDAWLRGHAADYGFFRPYDIDRGGVQPEPWHLSYAPLAAPALADLTLEVLADALASAVIDGAGEVLARLPDLHRQYVRQVAMPAPAALAAVALSGAARPS